MFASVDVGAAFTGCAVANGAGQMLAERTIPTLAHEGPESVLNRIAATVNDLASTAGERVLALGVGVPGLADFHRGRTVFLPNLPGGWRDLPVAERLSARVGCPVFLLNDARMAALGELWFGHGRNAKTMVAITASAAGWSSSASCASARWARRVKSATRPYCRTGRFAGAETTAAWRPWPAARR
jgi:glucokinase